MDKKEKMVWGIILAIVVLFIMFMPQIEGVLSGRIHLFKKNKKTKEVEKIDYPEQTSCTLAESTDPELNATVSKTVNFTYTESGTVDTIVLTTTSKFNDADGYNKNKNTKAKDRLGVNTQVSADDASKTLTQKDVMTIKDMVDYSGYPTAYTELKKYLSDNKYSCTEKK